ncbi:MAG: hypothetical protein ACREQ5_14315, partial [Candidatus Dormibacteria bacterium]
MRPPQTTISPGNAPVSLSTGRVSIDENDWADLSNDLYQMMNAALSERQTFDQNLNEWNDLYEMRQDQVDWPWVNSSSLVIPIIPAQLDAIVAYIFGKVFVPRFVMVSGNTPEAQLKASKVERYYNAELVRPRGTTTWYDRFMTFSHLAFRDGYSVMEVMWHKTTQKRHIVKNQPQVDEDGIPVLDMDTGETKTVKTTETVEIISYDDVDLQPVLAKDFVIIPAFSESVEAAVSVARALYMYEDQLQAMYKSRSNPDGVLSKKMVELALSYVPTGTNDYTTDRQGYYDRTMGDQMAGGIGQGFQASRFWKNRGPLKIWRIHSRAYDMDGDGIPEENIFWWHELSQQMLGWAPYSYLTPYASNPSSPTASSPVRPFF